METCVLIPQEFSLAVTAAGARSSGDQTVSVWSSTRIKQGEMYYPFQGTVRIDKLNILSYVSDEDVSTTIFQSYSHRLIYRNSSSHIMKIIIIKQLELKSDVHISLMYTHD